MTIVRSGNPRWACPARAIFSAESTASEPPLVKKTRHPSPIAGAASAAMRAASRSAGSFVKRSKHWYAARARICSAAASAISARPYPTAQYQSDAMPSTYRRPASSKTAAPSPRTIRTKSVAAGRAKGCRKAPGRSAPPGAADGLS